MSESIGLQFSLYNWSELVSERNKTTLQNKIDQQKIYVNYLPSYFYNVTSNRLISTSFILCLKILSESTKKCNIFVR